MKTLLQNKFLRYLPLLFLISIFTLTSCEKAQQDDKSITTSVDYTRAQSVLIDVFHHVDGIGKVSIDGGQEFPSNAKVTTSTGDFPKQANIDFRNPNSTYFDGRKRGGQISMVYNTNYLRSDSYVEVNIQDFTFDTKTLNGSMTVAAFGITENQEIVYKVNFTGKANSLPWTTEFFFTWVEGMNSSDNYFDDEHLITGTTEGVSSSGETFESEVSSALRRGVTCKWSGSGSVDILPGSKFPRIVNYGSGNCDNLVAIYIGLDQFETNLD